MRPALFPTIALLFVLTLGSFAPAAVAADKYRGFASENEALSACGKDLVIWVNKITKVYHLKGARWYGKTKDGAYACRAEADQAGFKQAKGEN